LKDELEQPILLEGVPTRLHFTVGVAVSRDPVALEDLLAEADLALIDAKERGGGFGTRADVLGGLT